MRRAGDSFGPRLVVGLLSTLAACASGRGTVPAPSSAACPQEAGSAIDRVCREDDLVRTLQARFRATVTVGDSQHTSEGVLLVRRPDAIRVKLFGLGGMTVQDATWVGDDRLLRGVVRRPLTGDPILVELRPGERLADPEAELSLAMWSLWRPRCAVAPTTMASEPGWFRLDPFAARVTARDVRVGPLGVDEERLVRAEDDDPDVVDVRYLDRDCSRPSLLPTRIEMESRERGWHASVRILEQKENPSLDADLFVVPETGVAPR